MSTEPKTRVKRAAKEGFRSLHCVAVTGGSESASSERDSFMAFSNYKNVSQIQQQFTIKYQEDNFVPPQEREPSDIFNQEFAFSMENTDVFTSDGARAEAVIFPVLREVYK